MTFQGVILALQGCIAYEVVDIGQVLAIRRVNTSKCQNMDRILIIDDDKRICDVLGEFLRRQGYEVSKANDGAAGLKAVQSSAPDLVICDLDMPSLDGQGVVSAMRRDQQNDEEIPVIFLSGCTDRAQIRRSMNLGGDDFITKPAQLPEILEAVKARLERSLRRRKQLDQQLEKTAEIVVGIIHDLNRSGEDVRWMADMDADSGGQRSQILEKLRQSMDAKNPVAQDKSGPSSVLVKKDSRQHLLKLSEVKALMACGEYSDVYWAKDQHIMFRKPLKQWESELPAEQFVRVHRQAIINLVFLDFAEKDSEGKIKVHLRDFKQPIPVSQREVANFNRRLKTFQARPAAS